MRACLRVLLMTIWLYLPPVAMAQEVMQLWVTVDWEGLSLEDDNLQAMQKFRQQFPQVPLLHLLNPAYFPARRQPGTNR